MFILVNGEWREISREQLESIEMTRHDIIANIENKRPSLIFLTFYTPIGKYAIYPIYTGQKTEYKPINHVNAYLLKYNPEYGNIDIKIDSPKPMRGSDYTIIGLDNIKAIGYLR